mgnify:CR=1 FL=1
MGLDYISVFVVAAIQLPVTFLVILNFPSVKLDFFATSVRTINAQEASHGAINGTAVDLHNPTTLHYMHSIPISFIFMIVSALCAFFVVMTIFLKDKGISINSNMHGRDVLMEEYVTSNVDLVTDSTIIMWNNVFVGIVVGSHVLVAAVVDSPTSIHLLLLVTFMIYTSSASLVSPKIHCEDPDASVRIATTKSGMYMTSVGLYCLAMGYIVNNIPVDNHSVKLQTVVFLLFVDMFLLVFGHTWDPTPLMQTIMNCRLIYIVCIVVLNITIYEIGRAHV